MASYPVSTTDALSERPTFVSRFPSRTHNKKEDITAMVQAYFLQHWPFSSDSQRKGYIKMDIEAWVMFLLPEAPVNRAEIYAAWMTFYFLYDDVLDRLPQTDADLAAERMAEIMLHNKTPSKPTRIEWIVHDLTQRTLASFSDMQGLEDVAQRFFEHACLCANAGGCKQRRLESLNGGFSKYLEFRFVDVGAWMALHGMFWARGIVLPPYLLSCPDMHALQVTALSQAILVNDLYSYRKELRDFKKDPENLIYSALTVLLQHDQLEPPEALKEIQRMIRSYEEEFLRLRKKLRQEYFQSKGDLDIITRASTALVDLMGGNTMWSTFCGRYNNF